MQSFGFQIVDDSAIGSESFIHKHCVKIDLQIMEPIQHNECHPNCVKCSKVIITSARHSNKTELAERLKEETVRNPDTEISDY